ncbi:MAG: hypothetical protein R2827_15295 [Bdellovibrionales bacterium]
MVSNLIDFELVSTAPLIQVSLEFMVWLWIIQWIHPSLILSFIATIVVGSKRDGQPELGRPPYFGERGLPLEWG